MSVTYSAKILNSDNFKNTKPPTKLITSENYLKNGYSLIKRNPFTKKIEITYSSNYDALNKEREQKRYKQGIETMISRWNNYRDEVNAILGDLSPYANYKETIRKMVEEDNYILEEIHKHNHNYSNHEHDSDYNSEGEDAKYLLS
jgi:hypothetical protein